MALAEQPIDAWAMSGNPPYKYCEHFNRIVAEMKPYLKKLVMCSAN
jgi:hypothetical protein